MSQNIFIFKGYGVFLIFYLSSSSYDFFFNIHICFQRLIQISSWKFLQLLIQYLTLYSGSLNLTLLNPKRSLTNLMLMNLFISWKPLCLSDNLSSWCPKGCLELLIIFGLWQYNKLKSKFIILWKRVCNKLAELSFLTVLHFCHLKSFLSFKSYNNKFDCWIEMSKPNFIDF